MVTGRMKVGTVMMGSKGAGGLRTSVRTSVRMSVRMSVRTSVRMRVRVASTAIFR